MMRRKPYYWCILFVFAVGFLACVDPTQTPKGEIVSVAFAPPNPGVLSLVEKLNIRIVYRNPKASPCVINVIAVDVQGLPVSVGLSELPSCSKAEGDTSIWLIAQQPVKVERFLIELFDINQKRSIASFVEKISLEWAQWDSQAPESSSVEKLAVSRRDLEEALGNLPQMLSQARAVPYFRAGQSIGLRLFAIKRESLFEKLGLKNGDILTAANGVPLVDISGALQIIEREKEISSLEVVLERNAREITLKYQWKGDFLTRTQVVAAGVVSSKVVSSNVTSSPPTPLPQSPESKEAITPELLTKERLKSELENAPRLISQARGVPYFRNGKTVGMRLFAIRRGSVWEQIGLMNGDILKRVNEETFLDSPSFFRVPEIIAVGEKTMLILERAQTEIEFEYSWKNSVLSRSEKVITKNVAPPLISRRAEGRSGNEEANSK